MIRPTQCKMARAALGLSVRALASKAGINFAAIVRFENGADIRSSNRDAIENALIEAGFRFGPDGSVRPPEDLIAA